MNRFKAKFDLLKGMKAEVIIELDAPRNIPNEELWRMAYEKAWQRVDKALGKIEAGNSELISLEFIPERRRK